MTLDVLACRLNQPINYSRNGINAMWNANSLVQAFELVMEITVTPRPLPYNMWFKKFNEKIKTENNPVMLNKSNVSLFLV